MMGVDKLGDGSLAVRRGRMQTGEKRELVWRKLNDAGEWFGWSWSGLLSRGRST